MLTSETRTNEGLANGSTRAWPFSFKVFAASHLQLEVRASSSADWSIISPALYTVALTADTTQPGTYSGGTISYPKSPIAVLAAPYQTRISRLVPYTQTAIRLRNASGYDPKVLEQEFDRNVMRQQQLRDSIAEVLGGVDVVVGPQGEQGEQGDPGPTGDPGARGDTGYPNIFVDTIGDLGDLPEPGTPGNNYLFIDGADTEIWSWVDDEWIQTGVLPPGATGATGAAGNTVLYGTAAPTTEGVNGNFYIRTTTSFIYGPKAAGVWPAGTSMIGVAGADGAGIVIAGSVATYASLPGGLGGGDAGDAYFVTADGKLYIWDGAAFPADGSGVEFQGPEGPAGEDGTDGVNGTDGLDAYIPNAAAFETAGDARWTKRASNLSDLASAVTARTNLDVAQKQSTVTDLTAGRGLIVGAFGVGASTANDMVTTGAAANDILTTSIYRVTSAMSPNLAAALALNLPIDGYGTIETIRYNATNATQKFTQGITGWEWKRRLATSVWGSWALSHVEGTVTTKTVSIPTDFSTLQAAFDYYIPVKDSFKKIIISIESGHDLTAGLVLSSGDFSMFWISHAGDGGTPGSVPVELHASFTGPNDSAISPPSNDPKADNLFLFGNCRTPVLNCQIDMDHVGSNGWHAKWNCHSYVQPNCGVINAGFNGFEGRNGTHQLHGSVWNGANGNGLRVTHGGTVNAQSAFADDCCQDAEGDTYGAIDVSRTSTMHFLNGSAQRSGAYGANIRRTSRVTLEGANFSDAVGVGVVIQNAASVAGVSMIINDCGSYGLWVRHGFVTAAGSEITGSVGGLDVRIGDSSPENSGAQVDLTSCELTAGTAPTAMLANISGADDWNLPGRYGMIWHQGVAGRMFMGAYSATGVTDGKTFDPATGAVLRSSRTGTSSQTHQTFANANGVVGSITTSASATAYATSSDGALKSNRYHVSEEGAAMRLERLEPVDFTWPDGTPGRGFIAQDAAVVYPGAVSGHGKPGDPDYEQWAMDYSSPGFIADLVAVIQQLRRRVNELESGS